MNTTVPSTPDNRPAEKLRRAHLAMTLLLSQQTADVRERRQELDRLPVESLELLPLRYAHRAARSALRGTLANVRAFALPIDGAVLDAADVAAEHDQ